MGSRGTGRRAPVWAAVRAMPGKGRVARHVLRPLPVAVLAVLLQMCASPSLSQAAGAATGRSAGSPLGMSCAAYEGGDTICSGELKSFDGAPIDTDVTEPAGPSPKGRRHPLIVLLHASNENKHTYESTNNTADEDQHWDWNSHWFAEHGFYVLTYTARGWKDRGPGASYEPDTPVDTAPGCEEPGGSACPPLGLNYVAAKEYEIKDLQWLSAEVAAAFPGVNPNAVAVSGGSEGGGESWMAAAEPVWSFPHSIDSALPVLHLRVSLPDAGFTDLFNGLLPDGHPGGSGLSDIEDTSSGEPGTPSADNPVGVPKESLIKGLVKAYSTNSAFAPKFVNWAEAIEAGEPYDEANGEDKPAIGELRKYYEEEESAYFQPGWAKQAAEGDEVAVFTTQGWTDPLFEANESIKMFDYLKQLDKGWPITLELGPIGHGSQDPDETWHRINEERMSFLMGNLYGKHHSQTGLIQSQQQICSPESEAADGTVTTAFSTAGLATSQWTVQFPEGGTLEADAGSKDTQNGDATFPNVSGPCGKAASSSAVGAYTSYSTPLESSEHYMGMGYVSVHYSAGPGQTAVLDARLFDVSPEGVARFVTRGTYRLDFNGYNTTEGTVDVPLYGNDWIFPKGDELRLDLLQADVPAFRAPTASVDSTLSFSPPQVVLPVRADSCSVASGAASVTGPAGGHLKVEDQLSTNLLESQTLVVAYQKRQIRIRLRSLEEAKCEGAAGERVFTGSGQATNAHETGDTVRFSIAEEADDFRLQASLYNSKGEAVLTEPISATVPAGSEKIE